MFWKGMWSEEISDLLSRIANPHIRTNADMCSVAR
jgi:hypothetical protein